MLFEGNIEVLDVLLEKQALLNAGDAAHEAYRPGLVIQGGAMRGVYGAGHAVALDTHGITEAFDVEIDASTGAPVGGYRLAGQVEVGRTVYWNECTTRDFFSLRRGLKGGHAMDIDFLSRVFYGQTPRGVGLNIDALRRSRTALYAAVTSAATGQGHLINVKENADPVNVIRASIALPWVSHGNVEVDGHTYLDGAVASPFPATEMLSRFKPTDILIFANCAKGDLSGGLGGMAASLLPDTTTPEIKEAFSTNASRFANELKALRAERECRWAIIWSDGDVMPFDQNPKKLETASRKAEEFLARLLAERRVLKAA